VDRSRCRLRYGLAFAGMTLNRKEGIIELAEVTLLRRIAILIIILAVGVGVSGSQSTNCIKFVVPDGSCSVLIPEKPELHTTAKDTESGEIVTNMWLVNDSQGFFLIGITDYPVDIDVQRELDLSRDNFLKAVDAKLVSESDFTLKGYRAKEFTGVSNPASDGNTFKSRVFVIGRRNYQTVARDETAKWNVERVNRFLLSFELTQSGE
jgi:hypothetical protein